MLPPDTQCTRDTSDTFPTYHLICTHLLNEWSLKRTWKTIIKIQTQNKTSTILLNNKKSRERKNVLHKTNYYFPLTGVSSYWDACQHKNSFIQSLFDLQSFCFCGRKKCLKFISQQSGYLTSTLNISPQCPPYKLLS